MLHNARACPCSDHLPGSLGPPCRVIGGVLDFYIFLGPSPEQVLQQYHSVIGRPAMVPHWSLGFHQCKWGYHTLGALQAVVEGYRQAGVPLEVIWSDIDYMDRYRCVAACIMTHTWADTGAWQLAS